jgi:hypothetical protein
MRIPSWLKRHRSNLNPYNVIASITFHPDVEPLIIVGDTMASMVEGMDHSNYKTEDCVPCFAVDEWKRLRGLYEATKKAAEIS